VHGYAWCSEDDCHDHHQLHAWQDEIDCENERGVSKLAQPKVDM
jgi:hypothetical protein